MSIIDAWMQHQNFGFLHHEVFASLWRWMHAQPPPEPDRERTLAAMDRVTVGMLCAWWGPGGPLITNDEVAEIVKRWPERIVGVASVDLFRPMDAVRELRRCVRDLGFRAVRVDPWLWGPAPGDRRYYPLYAECIDLDVAFCLQVGHTGPLRLSDPGRPIHISTTSRWSSPSCGSSVVTSATRGRRR